MTVLLQCWIKVWNDITAKYSVARQ